MILGGFVTSLAVKEVREHARTHHDPDCQWCRLWTDYQGNPAELDEFAAQPEPPDTWGEALWTAKELR